MYQYILFYNSRNKIYTINNINDIYEKILLLILENLLKNK